MARFVIHKHTREDDIHWDLMLEKGEVLVTWQVPREPEQWSRGQVYCEKIFDHRRKYLVYEGDIEGGRGKVCIVERGGYEPIEVTERCWRVEIEGDVLQGELELRYLKGTLWQLSYQGKQG